MNPHYDDSMNEQNASHIVIRRCKMTRETFEKRRRAARKMVKDVRKFIRRKTTRGEL